jgi:hypothetical protein
MPAQPALLYDHQALGHYRILKGSVPAEWALPIARMTNNWIATLR